MKSLQFPISQKEKPASYTLTYNGCNITDCMYKPWIICYQRKLELSKGWHKENLFLIKANK